MKLIASVATPVIAMTCLGPGVVFANDGETADKPRPVVESWNAPVSGVPQQTEAEPAPVGRHLQSYYSLKYYLSEDAGMEDGYPQGRSMVIERKGTRVYVTIVTMQGTPACFAGQKSGAGYVGTLDSGHPPYANWTLTIRKTRSGVDVTESHRTQPDGYTERYRHSSKAGIKRLFGWNAWKQHQHYQASLDC